MFHGALGLKILIVWGIARLMIAGWVTRVQMCILLLDNPILVLMRFFR